MNPDRIRVGISGLPLGNRSGTGYYTEQLLRVLSELGRSRFDVSVLPINRSPGGQRVPLGGDRFSFSLRWPFHFFADRVMENGLRDLDLIHYPNGVGPPILSKPLVTTLHDISPFLCPETFPRRTAAYLRKVFFNVCQTARIVLTDSHWQAERILELWPDLNKKLRVVYPTLSPVYRSPISRDPESAPSPIPYLLMVGTLEPRKQVDLAIRSWAESEISANLVLVGRWGWKAKGIRQALERIGDPKEVDLDETVWKLADGRSLCHLRNVPTGKLVDYYRNALALVYPSRFEGFGLPILEAMTVGCPVLTRKGSAMEEIAGSAGWYFDGDSKEALASSMEAIVKKSDLRHGRAVAGRELAKNFSDQRFYEGISSAYEAALG